MPQTVTVDPGPYGGDSIAIDELPAGELGVLVEAGPGDRAEGFYGRTGEPVVRIGEEFMYLGSDRISCDLETQVRRLRPGERITVEPQASPAITIAEF